MLAVAAIGVLAAAAALYFYHQAGTDPGQIRRTIAAAGQRACYDDARADKRNILATDAKLHAFCACTLDSAVAAMSDADAREAAVNALAMNTTMRTRLTAANRLCQAELN